MSRIGIIIIGLMSLLTARPVQEDSSDVTAMTNNPEVNRIIDSLRTQFRQIEDYQVRMTVSIKMPGLRMPKKRMNFSFKQPDKVNLKARGFAMVPKSGMMLSPDSMFAKLSEPVIVDSSNCACLLIVGNTTLMEEIQPRMTITVDTVRWVVTNVSTVIDEEQLFSLKTDYTEVLPDIYMPSETRMTLNISEEFMRINRMVARARREEAEALSDSLSTSAKIATKRPKSGEAIIRFTRYKINQGLDDALFEEEEE